jgi:hypothetical protein
MNIDVRALYDATPIRCNVAETLLGLKNSSCTSLLDATMKVSDNLSENRGSSEGGSVVGQGTKDEDAVDICKCRKSKCLKLYCACFANKQLCHPLCRCIECANTIECKLIKEAAETAIMERNPGAFESKFKPCEDAPILTHKTGCRLFLNLNLIKDSFYVHVLRRCRKSQCLKKYCECFNVCVYSS